jgi:hypothetical protein
LLAGGPAKYAALSGGLKGSWPMTANDWRLFDLPDGRGGQSPGRVADVADCSVVASSVASLVVEAPQPPVADEAPTNRLAGKLYRATDKALDQADEILSLPLDPDNSVTMRAKTAVMASVLTTQVRVDEGNLKRVCADRMPELLARLAELKRQNPKLLESPLVPVERQRNG